MRNQIPLIVIMALVMWSGLWKTAAADPCGMVPPIYGNGHDLPPLARIGEQKTYVFYKDGIETFVIRPGFEGKVDDFGMLIPFPTPPSVRKVPDNIFSHVANAVDPPEVVVDLRPVVFEPADMATSGAMPSSAERSLAIQPHVVRVIRTEAVGMYEVAVLEAGSAKALKVWMDEHGYKYPNGMDKACEDYVDDGWCFVAVKTRVGNKSGVDPQPGQRDVDARLPPGTPFDGFVQAMGFRFHSDELVVPMRLSAFNDAKEGKLHNIVYLLTDKPSRINKISADAVVRQVPGNELYRNITAPLPLRVIGGTIDDIPKERWQRLERQRDPVPKNGLAGELFASDLLAARDRRLSHQHEETEKILLRIGERFDLRGPQIDSLNEESLTQQRQEVVNDALKDLLEMTLTVVDGDFPKETVAAENLTFASYSIPAGRNSPKVYDAKRMGPAAGGTEGIVYVERAPDIPAKRSPWRRWQAVAVLVAVVIIAAGIIAIGIFAGRRRK